jgi:hypothetical protein
MTIHEQLTEDKLIRFLEPYKDTLEEVDCRFNITLHFNIGNLPRLYKFESYSQYYNDSCKKYHQELKDLNKKYHQELEDTVSNTTKKLAQLQKIKIRLNKQLVNAWMNDKDTENISQEIRINDAKIEYNTKILTELSEIGLNTENKSM